MLVEISIILISFNLSLKLTISQTKRQFLFLLGLLVGSFSLLE